MTIKAKYPGKCGACGGTIARGDQINWSKGAGANHIDCGVPDPVVGRGGYKRKRYDNVGHYLSSRDKYGIYTGDGTRIGVNCGCEDYPCCGH